MEEEDKSGEPKDETVEQTEESPPSPPPAASPPRESTPEPPPPREPTPPPPPPRDPTPPPTSPPRERTPSPRLSQNISPGPKTPLKSPSRSVTIDAKSKSPGSKTPQSEGRSPKSTPRKLTSGGMEESDKENEDEVSSFPNVEGGRSTTSGPRAAQPSSMGSPGAPSSVVAAGPPGSIGVPAVAACTAGLLQKRSPFIHNPPQPEERRARIQCPRTPREYIINLREDLADFQESHGLPRTRDYSFVSLGLALAQETGRALYSLFLMMTELFPILAILSLILRFALDKLIEILETTETVPKVKKTVIFALEMMAIMIPLWILTATIILPLLSLILSIFKRMLRIRGGKKKAVAKPKPKAKAAVSGFL